MKGRLQCMSSEKQLEEPVAFYEKVWIDSVTKKINVKYLLKDDLVKIATIPNLQTIHYHHIIEIDNEDEIKLYQEKGETALLVKKNSECYKAISYALDINAQYGKSEANLWFRRQLKICQEFLNSWFDERGFEFKDGKYYAREKAIVNKEPSEIKSIPETVKPSESKLNDSEVQKITSEDQSPKKPSLSFKDAKNLLKKLETEGYDKRMSPDEKEIFNHKSFNIYISRHLGKCKEKFSEIYRRLINNEQISLTEFYKICSSPSSFYNEKLKNSMKQYCSNPRYNTSLDKRYILEFRQKNISPTEDKKELIEVMYLREKKK